LYKKVLHLLTYPMLGGIPHVLLSSCTRTMMRKRIRFDLQNKNY
jgi:hypothetical protein